MFIMLTRHVTRQDMTLLFDHNGNILLFMDERLYVTKKSLVNVKGDKEKMLATF